MSSSLRGPDGLVDLENPSLNSQQLDKEITQSLIEEFGAQIQEMPAFPRLCKAIFERLNSIWKRCI